MTPLAAALRRRIADTGPIGVDDYVAAALADPVHGYYATRDPFGAGGDFVTAPEISQAFGELIGLWCAACWETMGRPAPVRLVELGPGRGTLMVDALRAIGQTTPAFARALRLVLVEIGPSLRKRQAEALAAAPLAEAPLWVERFADVPDGPLLLIANEFFDALPVKQFVRTAAGWCERRIGLSVAGDRFTFVEGPPAPLALPEALAEAPEGAVLELCPAAEELAGAIGGRVATARGAALIIDYGHPHPHWGETLQAVRRHRFADVLDRPGETDLSHHVDFGALKVAAAATGAKVYGPIPQGLFLGRLGIVQRAKQLAAARPDQADAIVGAIRRLVHPREMGALFRALALAAPHLPPPPGFT